MNASAAARWLAAALVSALSVLLFGQLAARLALAPLPAYALGFSVVSAQIVGVSLCAAEVVRRASEAPVSFRAWPIALGGALIAIGCHGLPASVAAAAALAFGLLLAASWLGAALGARIAHVGHVSAVAWVSAVVDVWSVCDPTGPSAQVAAKVLAEPAQLSAAVLWFPLFSGAGVSPLIGVGDVVFAALYAGAFARHGLLRMRLGAALMAGFLGSLLVLLALAKSLPLLPFLAAAVLLSDRRVRSLTVSEQRTVGVTVLLLLAAAGARLAL